MYQTAPDVSPGYQDRAPSSHTTRRWQLRQALATANVDISNPDTFPISLALIRTRPAPDARDPIPRGVTDGTTSESPPLYQFVQDWTNELQLLITRPDCRLLKFEATKLAVEGYTRTFILLEFIVQQVLNELVSHLELFGDLPKMQEVLVMIELISYQRRKCDPPQECILRLEDLHNMSTRLMDFLRHTAITRRGQHAWTELFAQIEAYATYPYPTPVATHPISRTSWPLISPTVSSCSSHSSLSSDVPEANHNSPGFQSTSHSTQHAENTSISQEPTLNQTLPDALKHYIDNSTKSKALYVDMLKKQEDSMSQLRAACKHFVELENACRDQAKQTFDNLFGGTPATEVVSDVLRAMAPSNAQSTILATPPTANDRAQTPPTFHTSGPVGFQLSAASITAHKPYSTIIPIWQPSISMVSRVLQTAPTLTFSSPSEHVSRRVGHIVSSSGDTSSVPTYTT
ncbi:uncharacterized protein STEHIDRAFT_151445 [Stereum hirsutum FP-91666 SS1]|uniref:uncharacterized protein n=1 Tax=Stereum hirsutum (strain FP-91666) TaxID=721885 RepID=UPI000440ACD7|nr:uncharacterized protein STEHIDRAFT_151445 [Stereum hirsutum FP-91666 SS1]EIM92101.1 hypothetical protein STEHIDRAFT_151445 [Stereum hirsutum FP-91666 SS1]